MFISLIVRYGLPIKSYNAKQVKYTIVLDISRRKRVTAFALGVCFGSVFIFFNHVVYAGTNYLVLAYSITTMLCRIN